MVKSLARILVGLTVGLSAGVFANPFDPLGERMVHGASRSCRAVAKKLAVSNSKPAATTSKVTRRKLAGHMSLGVLHDMRAQTEWGPNVGGGAQSLELYLDSMGGQAFITQNGFVVQSKPGQGIRTKRLSRGAPESEDPLATEKPTQN